MLNVLLGSGVGDIVAVVTRYYGGTKLGKGGLVRAYSGGVKAALEELALEELVHTTTLRVTVAYSDVSTLKHSLPQFEAKLTSEDYGTRVTLIVVLPEEHAGSFSEALAGMTSGKAAIERA
jgi:putative IMPACT (imprinted ancient) family translation regulator